MLSFDPWSKRIETGLTTAIKVVDIEPEAEGAEGDPFHDAMVAAVADLAEAMEAEKDARAELEARSGRLVRRA